MRTPIMLVVSRSRMDWKTLPACLTLLLLGLCLAFPPGAQATAIATSSIAFSNLSIVPASGSVILPDAWTLAAFAQAQNSLGELEPRFALQFSPSTAAADAVVTYADSHGQASALHTPPDLLVTGMASSTVNIPGCNGTEAFSTGHGTLFKTFMITGGTGAVAVQLGADITANLHVLTDACGGLADTEVNFHLDIDGEPQLFYNTLLAIGPSDEALLSASPSLTHALALQYDTPYFLLLEVDSESHGRSDVPEPSTLLLLLSGCLGLLLTA
jgi:hypothetical protein